MKLFLKIEMINSKILEIDRDAEIPRLEKQMEEINSQLNLFEIFLEDFNKLIERLKRNFWRKKAHAFSDSVNWLKLVSKNLLKENL